MPTLDNGQYPASTPRTSAPRVGFPGVTESLDAPGLVPLPPVSRGASAARQLAEELGIGLRSLAGVTHGLAHLKRHEEVSIRAQGAQLAAEQWPSIQEAVRSGKFDAIDGSPINADGADAAAQARSILDSVAPPDMHALKKAELYDRLVPAIAGSIVDRRRALNDESDSAFTREVMDLSTLETSAEKLRDNARALAEGLNTKVSADEAERAVGRHALQAAAEAGDMKAWDAASSFLGDRERLWSDQQESRLRVETDRQNAQVVRAAESAVELKIADNDFEGARAMVRQIAASGELPESVRAEFEASGLLKVDAAEEAAANRYARLNNDRHVSTVQTQVRDSLLSVVANPDEPMKWPMIRDFEFTDLYGNRRVYHAAEQKADALAAFKEQAAALPAAEQMPALIQFLADAQATDPELSARMESIAAADFTGKSEKDLPAPYMENYAVAKLLHAAGLLDDHASQEAYDRFSDAMALEKYTKLPPDSALIQAARPNLVAKGSVQITHKMIEEELDAEGLGFTADVMPMEIVRAIAEFRVRKLAMTEEAAVRSAVEDFARDYIAVNGATFRKARLGMSDAEVRAAGEVLIDYFLSQSDHKDIYERDSLTVGRDERTEEFYIKQVGQNLDAIGSPRLSLEEFRLVSAKFNEATGVADRVKAYAEGRRRILDRNRSLDLLEKIGVTPGGDPYVKPQKREQVPAWPPAPHDIAYSPDAGLPDDARPVLRQITGFIGSVAAERLARDEGETGATTKAGVRESQRRQRLREEDAARRMEMWKYWAGGP